MARRNAWSSCVFGPRPSTERTRVTTRLRPPLTECSSRVRRARNSRSDPLRVAVVLASAAGPHRMVARDGCLGGCWDGLAQRGTARPLDQPRASGPRLTLCATRRRGPGRDPTSASRRRVGRARTNVPRRWPPGWRITDRARTPAVPMRTPGRFHHSPRVANRAMPVTSPTVVRPTITAVMAAQPGCRAASPPNRRLTRT
jgi:hypothetical protein